MKESFHANKLGVLGGGQLGRMLIQEAVNYNLQVEVIDPDANAPCKAIAHQFTHGSLTDYETILKFGRDHELLTIEIENVNTDALKQLEAEGVKVYPQPDIIALIKNKVDQKSFYKANDIPTAPFEIVQNKFDVARSEMSRPFVNKLATEGYDGRGVQVIRSAEDLDKAFDAPGLVEAFVDFDREISVIVARNRQGEIRTFPTVELEFHPEANLVEFLHTPAKIKDEIDAKAKLIAIDIIKKLDMVGLLAVEMFVTKTGEVLVNEIAPRTHNSGHHTIESCVTSQFNQHLRAILGLPLGNTSLVKSATMVNLLGEEGHTGPAQYEGLEEVLGLKGVYVHLYGKALTKPFRKMGHVTITGGNRKRLLEKANFVKETLKVKS
jgi:5-(carboxyamino)imidazole ribonucleotide synthase